MSSSDNGGSRWPVLLPGAIGIIAAIVIWQALLQAESHLIHRETKALVSSVKRTITHDVGALVQSLMRQGQRWEFDGGTPRDKWMMDAGLYLKDRAGYRALAWLDADDNARWIVTPAGEGQMTTNVLTALAARMDVFERASDEKRPLLATAPGSGDLLAVIPLRSDEAGDGHIVAVFQPQPLLASILGRHRHIDVQIIAGEQVLYADQHIGEEHWQLWMEEEYLALFGVGLTVRVAPTEDEILDLRSNLPLIGLLVGITGSLLLSGLVVLLRQSRRDNVALARSQKETRDLMDELRASDERLGRVVDNTPHAIVLVDAEGRIALVNRTVEKMFGWSVDELTGKPVEALVPDSYCEQHRQDRAQYLQNPVARPMSATANVTARRRDGSIFPVEVSLIPYTESDGATKVLAMVADVTERRNAEAKVRRTMEELERSNAELGQFAYVASHDLRAPLRGIDNLAKWIDEDSGDLLPEDTRNDLKTMRGRVERMEALLDALLQYSRIGRKEDKPTPVSIDEIIEDVKVMNDLPAGCTIEATTDMPVVHAPRGALMRVFGNLIGNALKHSQGDTGKIRLRHRQISGYHFFEISDDGPGIAPEFHERVFGMFQTLQPRDRQEGSGMGLALVKKTVEYHGGQISLNSTPGEGAAFTFTWPIKDPRSTPVPTQETHDQPTLQKPPAAASPATLKNRTPACHV